MIRIFSIPACLRVTLCVLAVFLCATPAHAADITLYDRILDVTRRDLLLNARSAMSPERSVFDFVKHQLPNITTRVERADFDGLFNQRDDLCGHNDPAVTGEQCISVRSVALDLAQREQTIKTAARDWQIIASGFEEPLLGGFVLPLTEQMQGISRMWKADTVHPGAHAEDTPLIRAENIPDSDNVKAAVKALATALKKMIINDTGATAPDGSAITPSEIPADITELSAAVWRYRFTSAGFSEPSPHVTQQFLASATGTEQELAKKRWPELEEWLQAITDDLKRQADKLDLAPGEIALFTFPESLEKLLPDNVLLWSYIERLKDGKIHGDTGLQWKYALEPAPLTICSKQPGGDCVPLPGGMYPPAPGDEPASPLCMFPLMRAGNLCANPASEQEGDTCGETVDDSGDTIRLGGCTEEEPVRETEPGGDVCADPSWQSGSQEFDPQTQCRVELKCDSNATGSFDAVTDKKSPEGITTVTMKDGMSGDAVSLFLHELTHVKQSCHLPPGSYAYDQAQTPQERLDVCCALEGEANRVQCNAMAEDGTFDGALNNAETCTQILTDMSCRDREIRGNNSPFDQNHGACPWSLTYHLTYAETKAKFDTMGEGSRPQPDITCSDIVDPDTDRPKADADPRIIAAVESIENIREEDVCTPLAQTEFENTAGNTMCFLNRCWKQSLTLHRLTPSRTPVIAGESAYPFDVCMAPDPGLGKIIPGASPRRQWIAPPYRPARLLQYLEETLCPGLPLGSPLCSFDPQRRLDLYPKNQLDMAQSIIAQEDEFQRPKEDLETLGAAIGMRIGNDLYGGMLRNKAGGLQDFVTAAASLLSQFPKATFPTAVCPLNGSDSLCASSL